MTGQLKIVGARKVNIKILSLDVKCCIAGDVNHLTDNLVSVL